MTRSVSKKEGYDGLLVGVLGVRSMQLNAVLADMTHSAVASPAISTYDPVPAVDRRHHSTAQWLYWMFPSIPILLNGLEWMRQLLHSRE